MKDEYQAQRNYARIFAGIVYTGVVVAATTLFISFVLTAFPANAYFSRFVMTIAGVLIGSSAIAFPFALHTWAISDTHRKVTIALYYGEMGIIAINTIVSFSVLLAKYTGITIPEWVWLYEPFSVIAIVYTLGAWGTVFLLDPEAQARNNEKKAQERFNRKVSDKMLEFLDSLEGEDAILAAAQSKIEKQFGSSNFDNTPKHFGSQKGIPVEIPATRRNEASTEQAKLADPTHPSQSQKD